MFRQAKYKSYLLVSLQLLTIGYLLVSGDAIPKHWILWILQLFAVSIGLWAVAIMSTSKFNVSPEVRDDASLISTGIYRFIRHPMYTSVLLIGLGLLINDFSWFRAGVYVLLFIVLVTKLFYEESMLIAHFPQYRNYIRHNWRLVPFIF